MSSVVVTTKTSDSLRVCIDRKPLNAALKWERCQFSVLDDLLPELAKANVFWMVDLGAGYWHCILDELSLLLQHPMGGASGADYLLDCLSHHKFSRRESTKFQINGILEINDDILIYWVRSTEDAYADHDQKLKCLLGRCKEGKGNISGSCAYRWWT